MIKWKTEKDFFIKNYDWYFVTKLTTATQISDTKWYYNKNILDLYNLFINFI